MNTNDYLLRFFAELERLADGQARTTRSRLPQTGALEIRLGSARATGTAPCK